MKDVTEFIYRKLEEMLINSSDEFGLKNKNNIQDQAQNNDQPFHIPNNILQNIETDTQYKDWVLDITFNHLGDDIVMENFSKIIAIMTFGSQQYLVENLIKKIDGLIEEDFDIEETKKLFQKSLFNEIKTHVLDMYIIVDPIDLGSYYAFLQGIIYDPASIETDYNKNLPKNKKLSDFYDFNSEYDDYFNDRLEVEEADFNNEKDDDFDLSDDEKEEYSYERMKKYNGEKNKKHQTETNFEQKYSSNYPSSLSQKSNSGLEKEKYNKHSLINEMPSKKERNDELIKEAFEGILSLNENRQKNNTVSGKVERNTTRLTNTIFEGKAVNEETIDYMTENHNFFNSALISIYSRFLIKELTENKEQERMKNKEKLFYFFKNLSDGNSELFKESIVKFKKFLIEKEQRTFLNQNEQTKEELYHLTNHANLRKEDKMFVLKTFDLINKRDEYVGNDGEEKIRTRSDGVFEERRLKPKMIRDRHFEKEQKYETNDEDNDYIHHINKKKMRRASYQVKQEEIVDFSTTQYKDLILSYINGGKWNSIFEKEKFFNNEDFIKEFVFFSLEKSTIVKFKLEELLPSFKKLKKQKEMRNGKEEEVFIENTKDETVQHLEKCNSMMSNDLNIISMFYTMADKEYKRFYFKYISAYMKQFKVIFSVFEDKEKDHELIVELYVNACCAFLSSNKNISSDKEFYEESKKGIMKALCGKYLY